MRMYFSLTMDRPVDKDIHYISPGGFEFQFGKHLVAFDFFEFCGGIDDKDDRKVNCEMRCLDTTSFPESEILLSGNLLGKVKHIEDFYVYTGEQGYDPELYLEKIDSISFDHDGKNYSVPQKVIETYNEKLKKERESQGITK